MENVMLNNIQTQVKIVDFGLSNTYDNQNPLRTHCGSPEYAAPELFVAGKQYGPEVDLWSLGVILYGMVVGQLPFMSSRDDHVTSQERRKRLLAQINKGLATPQRKALAAFSLEFRTMMSKLLIADSTKRITIKELIFHPWITEKGKKAIRTNPIKPLESHWRTRIINELGSLLQADNETIEIAIKNEPQGAIGGMFKILIYKHHIEKLEGNGITRTLQNPALGYISPRLNSSHSVRKQSANAIFKPNVNTNIKKVEPIKSAPARKAVSQRSPIVPEQLTRPSTATPGGNSLKEYVSATGKMPVRTVSSAKQPQSPSKETPQKKRTLHLDKLKSVACTSSNNAYKLTSVQSPLRVENRLTNMISPKTSVATRCSCGKIRSSSSSSQRRTETSKTCNSNAKPVKHELERKVILSPANPTALQSKKDIVKIQSATVRKPPTKSESLEAPHRPVSTGPPVLHTAARAIKRRSLLPVTTQSTPVKGADAAVSPSATERGRRATSSKIPVSWEKSPHAIGDANKRPTTPAGVKPPQPWKAFSNEPIARSIADYVVNKIPTKHTFQWVKNPTPKSTLETLNKDLQKKCLPS